MQTVSYTVPIEDGASLAWLYEHGEVTSRTDSDSAIQVTVRLFPANRTQFEHDRDNLRVGVWPDDQGLVDGDP